MSFVDLDNQAIQPEESVGQARISTSGIHHNIIFKGVTLEEKPADPAKKKKGYTAAKFTFENENGEIHEEMYFKPPSDVSDLPTTSDWRPDRYEKLEGKSTKVGKVNDAQYVQILNNDFAYFILDLADALGFAFDKAKSVIATADTFEECVKIFRDKFCKDLDKKRISMKLLWSNNDKDRTSYLRLHDFLVYYPFKNDIFDIYNKGRNTVLFISDYESKNKGSQKYQNERKPSGSTENTGTTSNDSYSQASTNTDDDKAEADPF